MRALVALALVTALLAGCSSPSGDDAADDGGRVSDAPSQESRMTRPLGWLNHTEPVTMADTFDFTFTVPEGGAANADWSLLVMTSDNGGWIEGDGCIGGPSGVGASVAVLGGVGTSGQCGTLAAGEHTVTVHINVAGLGFEAIVHGQVLA